jgi:hypothetical protein
VQTVWIPCRPEHHHAAPPLIPASRRGWSDGSSGRLIGGDSERVRSQRLARELTAPDALGQARSRGAGRRLSRTISSSIGEVTGGRAPVLPPPCGSGRRLPVTQRGGRPRRLLSRRFFRPAGRRWRDPRATAFFMATHSRAESTRSNHSSLPSRSAATTEPWQIFWQRTTSTLPTLQSDRTRASCSQARTHFLPPHTTATPRARSVLVTGRHSATCATCRSSRIVAVDSRRKLKPTAREVGDDWGIDTSSG